MNKRFSQALCAGALLFAAAAAGAQGYDTTLNFPPGTYRFGQTIETRLVTESPAMGGDLDMTVKVESAETFVVTGNTRGDEFETVTILDSYETSVSVLKPEAYRDLLEQTMEASYADTPARALGNTPMTYYAGRDGSMEPTPETVESMRQVLSGTAMEAFDPVELMKEINSGYPYAEIGSVSVGESRSVTVTQETNGYLLDLDITYTLSRADADALYFDTDTSGGAAVEIEQSGYRIIMDIAAEGTGSLTLERESRLLIEERNDLETRVAFRINGEESESMLQLLQSIGFSDIELTASTVRRQETATRS